MLYEFRAINERFIEGFWLNFGINKFKGRLCDESTKDINDTKVTQTQNMVPK